MRLNEANEPKPRANPDYGNTVVWEMLASGGEALR